MPSYNPNCDNCAKCGTCRGEGWIRTTKRYDGPNGKSDVRHEKVTCPTCRGVGGKPMAGKHNHS